MRGTVRPGATVIVLIAEAGVEFGIPAAGRLAVLRAGTPTAELKLDPHTVTVLAATGDAPVPVTEFGTAELFGAVQQLVRARLLRISCCDDVASELMWVRLTTGVAVFDLTADPGERAVRLSRHAVIRRDNDDLVVESPVAGTLVTVVDQRAAGMLVELNRPRTALELAKALPFLAEAAVAALVRLLLGAAVVAVADDDGLLPEDGQDTQAG